MHKKFKGPNGHGSIILQCHVLHLFHHFVKNWKHLQSEATRKRENAVLHFAGVVTVMRLWQLHGRSSTDACVCAISGKLIKVKNEKKQVQTKQQLLLQRRLSFVLNEGEVSEHRVCEKEEGVWGVMHVDKCLCDFDVVVCLWADTCTVRAEARSHSSSWAATTTQQQKASAAGQRAARLNANTQRHVCRQQTRDWSDT